MGNSAGLAQTVLVSASHTSSFRDELLSSEKAAAAELRATALDRQKHRRAIGDLSVRIDGLDELHVVAELEGGEPPPLAELSVYVEICVEGHLAATPCAALEPTSLLHRHRGRATIDAGIVRPITDVTGDVRLLVWQRRVEEKRGGAARRRDAAEGLNRSESGDARGEITSRAPALRDAKRDLLIGQVIVPLTSCVDVTALAVDVDVGVGGADGARGRAGLSADGAAAGVDATPVASVVTELAKSVWSGLWSRHAASKRRSCSSALAPSPPPPTSMLVRSGDFWINTMPPLPVETGRKLAVAVDGVAARKFDPTLGRATSIIKAGLAGQGEDARRAVIQRTATTLLSGVQELFLENYSLTRKRGHRDTAATAAAVAAAKAAKAAKAKSKATSTSFEKEERRSSGRSFERREGRKGGGGRGSGEQMRSGGAAFSHDAATAVATSAADDGEQRGELTASGGRERGTSFSYTGTLASLVTAGGWEDVSPEGQRRYLAARSIQATVRGRLERRRVGRVGAGASWRDAAELRGFRSAAAAAAQVQRAQARRGRLSLRIELALRPNAPRLVAAYWASPPARANEWPTDPATFDHNFAIQAGVRLRHSAGLRALVRGRGALFAALLLAASWRNVSFSLYVAASWCFICSAWYAWWQLPLIVALLIAASAAALRPTPDDVRQRYASLVADADTKNAASSSELSELTYIYSRLGLLQEYIGAVLRAIEGGANLLAFADARVTVAALAVLVVVSFALTLILGAVQILATQLGARRSAMLVGLAVLLLPKVLFSTLCGRGVGLRADGGGVKRQARRRRRNACCRSALRQTLNGARNFMARVPGEMELLHRHVAAQQERRPAAHRRRLALVGFGSNDVGDGVVTAAADGSARAARSSSGHVAGTWDGGLHGELLVPMRTVAVDARELFASPTSLGPAGGGVGVDARSGSDSGGRNDARTASSAARFAALCGVYVAVDCDDGINGVMPLLRDSTALVVKDAAAAHPWLERVSLRQAWLTRLEDGRWAVGPTPRPRAPPMATPPRPRASSSEPPSSASVSTRAETAAALLQGNAQAQAQGVNVPLLLADGGDDDAWLVTLDADTGPSSSTGPVGLTWTVLERPAKRKGHRAMRKERPVYAPADSVRVVDEGDADLDDGGADAGAKAGAVAATTAAASAAVSSPMIPPRRKNETSTAGGDAVSDSVSADSDSATLELELQCDENARAFYPLTPPSPLPRTAIEAVAIVEHIREAGHTEFVLAVSRSNGGGNVVVRRYAQFVQLFERVSSMTPPLASLRGFTFPPKWNVVQSIEVALWAEGKEHIAIEERVAALNVLLGSLTGEKRAQRVLSAFCA